MIAFWFYYVWVSAFEEQVRIERSLAILFEYLPLRASVSASEEFLVFE